MMDHLDYFTIWLKTLHGPKERTICPTDHALHTPSIKENRTSTGKGQKGVRSARSVGLVGLLVSSPSRALGRNGLS